MTTLLVSSPRVSSNRLRSDDQLKSKIRPEINFVNCFGFRPERGCSQMLVVPLSVTRYCKSVPVGDHRTREVPPGTEHFCGRTAVHRANGYLPHGWIFVEGIREQLSIRRDIQRSGDAFTYASGDFDRGTTVNRYSPDFLRPMAVDVENELSVWGTSGVTHVAGHQLYRMRTIRIRPG